MGKAKSAKKGVNSSNNPTPKAGSNSVNALEADLASLEEGKRQKACMLLADLYTFNISNKYSLDALTSSNILNKLGMRLVDTSEKVRVEGSNALKSLSECKDISIIKRIMSVGILRSASSLCVQILSGDGLHTPEGSAFAENLLHTLSNAVSCCDTAIHEIISTSAEFMNGLFSMVNMNSPADVTSAVANLLIIIANHCDSSLVLGSDNAQSPVFSARMETVWTFVESLNGLKSAPRHEIAQQKMFAVASQIHSNATKQVQGKQNSQQQPTEEETHEQRAFQMNVLMIECLEIVISVFTHAPHSPALVEACRINRALLLLNLELHSSLDGIQVALPASAASEAPLKDRKNSSVSMDEESASEAETGAEAVRGADAVAQMDPIALANLKRLGLCKTLAGVLSGMLEGLSGESQNNATVAQNQSTKAAVVAHLLWELQSYSTLLQCYNAAFYFIAASTAPGDYVTTSASSDSAVSGESGATSMKVAGVEEGSSETRSKVIAITPSVLEGLDCCDQLASSLGQLFSLLAATSPVQLRESGLVDASLYMQLVQPLFDLITTTSPVAEGSATGWKAPYFVDQGVTENGFRRSLLAAASSLVEFLALLGKRCTTVTTSAPTGEADSDAAVVLTEEQLKELSVLLVKGSGFPNVEVAVSSVVAMSALGQRDFAIREATAGQCGLLNTVLNALLTNALLRRLQDPNAYSCDTAQHDKQLRLLEGRMQLMDSCFNAIVDLHTSDDVALLSNYVKLQGAAKLQERASFFASMLGSPAAHKLDRNDLEKFSETLENVESFIQYKAGFTK